ncbi:serine/threonine specific protein phosphatase, partial [Cardiosporidium cionae]
KRFFDRLTPVKGSRYAVSSDSLKYYPRFVLELLQGPFGQTAYDHAMRFRYISSPAAYNYTYSSHIDELILPPPEGTKDVRLWMGCFGIPRDDKRHRGGEDAWFSTGGLNAMGVADGVSEWMDLAGVNPRDFAEDLLKGAVEELCRLKAKGILEEASSSPAEFAEKAMSIAFNNAKHFGSVANLGDSGGLILRRSNTCGELSILYRVEEMQHGFNIPYQFIHLPSPDEWEQLQNQGMTRIVKFAQNEWRRLSSVKRHIGDTPEDIRSSNVSVCEGDLIILGSDGLFDNLFDYEIASLTALAISPREAKLLCHDIGWATPPKDIARSLALASYWKSLNPQANTPFAKYSKKFYQHRGLIDLFGGKEDDISVAVAWVALGEDTLADI